MTLRLVEGPTTLPVTVAEAKANGRIDADAEDALVEALIRAALGYAERYCGMAFEAQTWEVVIDKFPENEIELPLGKVTGVESVSYVDEDGVIQVVASSDYVVDLVSRDGWVVPVHGFDWPLTMATINAVTVRFIAGAGTPDDVKQAILLMVEFWYEQRATASETAMQEIPFGSRAILDLHRRMFV